MEDFYLEDITMVEFEIILLGFGDAFSLQNFIFIIMGVIIAIMAAMIVTMQLLPMMIRMVEFHIGVAHDIVAGDDDDAANDGDDLMVIVITTWIIMMVIMMTSCHKPKSHPSSGSIRRSRCW